MIVNFELRNYNRKVSCVGRTHDQSTIENLIKDNKAFFCMLRMRFRLTSVINVMFTK